MTNTVMTKIAMIDLSKETARKSLLLEGDTHKRIVVERLGIEIQEGETPVDAWMRHLAEINNLPATKPCHPQIKDAICASPEAMRFLFFIA